MSLNNKYELDLLSGALRAMESRSDVLHRLSNVVNETPGLGIESWFQIELLLHPFPKNLMIRKIQTPYDLEVTINKKLLKVEIKAITANDFKERIVGWYYPNKETKKFSIEELIEIRKKVKILFLSLRESYENAVIDTEKLVTPKIYHIDNNWVVGIIKRK